MAPAIAPLFREDQLSLAHHSFQDCSSLGCDRSLPALQSVENHLVTIIDEDRAKVPKWAIQMNTFFAMQVQLQ